MPHPLTLPEDRAFRAFTEHHNPGSAGQLLAALHAYRDCMIELGYMPLDARGMAPNPFVDAAERAAIGQLNERKRDAMDGTGTEQTEEKSVQNTKSTG